MSISYSTPELKKSNDGFAGILSEAADIFETQHQMGILGESFGEIASDNALFESYKEALLSNAEANDAAELDQLFNNTRLETLQEASLNGISPISSLAMPAIRKLWPRLSLKNAIPTEPVKVPKFTVSYIKPYLTTSAGVRKELPADMVSDDSAILEGTKLVNTAIAYTALDGTGVDFLANSTYIEGSYNPASAGNDDSIDTSLVITELAFEDGQSGDDKVTGTLTGLQLGFGLDGSFFYEYSVDTTDSNTPANTGTATGTLVGHMDFKNGVLKIVDTKGAPASTTVALASIKVDGRLSCEYNNSSDSVGFDIDTEDLTIGHGDHLNAPLPIEFLQDVMAMYNIDGAAKAIEILTDVYGLKLEKELNAFIVNASAAGSNATFDCRPEAEFSGTPKEWRTQLVEVVDFLATNVKQSNYYSGGVFNVIGNTSDIKLLPGINWTFTGAQQERSGVQADYSLGAIAGENVYNIISSPIVTKGAVHGLYVSSNEEQLTYRYYPYAFSLQKSGYADPNHPNVPSIMMAKRHLVKKFKDASFKVTVTNNTAAGLISYQS